MIELDWNRVYVALMGSIPSDYNFMYLRDIMPQLPTGENPQCIITKGLVAKKLNRYLRHRSEERNPTRTPYNDYSQHFYTTADVLRGESQSTPYDIQGT